MNKKSKKKLTTLFNIIKLYMKRAKSSDDFVDGKLVEYLCYICMGQQKVIMDLDKFDGHILDVEKVDSALTGNLFEKIIKLEEEVGELKKLVKGSEDDGK